MLQSAFTSTIIISVSYLGLRILDPYLTVCCCKGNMIDNMEILYARCCPVALQVRKLKSKEDV